MTDLLSGACVLVGVLFIFIAAVGIIKMPDLLMRMHAATKAGTMGSSLILIGLLIKFNEADVIIESLLTITFIFITMPIASHLLAKAAYFRGIQLYKNAVIDELKQHLDSPDL